MGQEFIIKSQKLEDKVNQLLPSQGGFQAGVDLSASTTIIPIVDLTESAEGSEVRQDLQTAFSHTNTDFGEASNATATIINTTGYWKIMFNILGEPDSSAGRSALIQIDDGTTSKNVYIAQTLGASQGYVNINDSIVVKLTAGDSCKLVVSADLVISCTFRQIADINGNLIDP